MSKFNEKLSNFVIRYFFTHDSVKISNPKSKKFWLRCFYKCKSHIHFNERANLDRDAKRKIINQIVGIKKSIQTQAAIMKLRQENPELNKNQMKHKFKYSINTLRRYWDKEIICFEKELERINHKYAQVRT